MLTTPHALALYVCEAFAYTPMGPRHELGAHAARSPRLALRWLRCRIENITDQLDPPAAQPGHHWLRNEKEHERVLARLAAGQPYTFILFEDTTRYALIVRPTT